MSARGTRILRSALATLLLSVAATSTAQEAGYRAYAPGLLARTVYTTRDRVVVEIWDLMVGPGKVAERIALPGAAVLEVRMGAGTLELRGERKELRMGSVATVPTDTAFGLANASGEQPFVLRAVIVRPVSP